jgi:hypothetical protein
MVQKTGHFEKQIETTLKVSKFGEGERRRKIKEGRLS